MADPNIETPEVKDAPANPETPAEDTGTETTANPTPEAEPDIDYKTKFAESSKGAQALLDENKRLKAELEAKGTEETPPANDLYPGFEELDPEAKANLIAYTDMVTKRAEANLLKNPAISFAQSNYNEKKWNDAFAEVVTQHPQLANSKEEFKGKYFNASNVPDNISTILGDLAKIYLFDKAKEIGIQEEKDRAGRVDQERSTGGEKTPTASRTLADWQRMAQSNPAEFARHAKEYNADLEAGKLKQ